MEPKNRSKIIGKNLILWFEKNQRKLPWRAHYDPYEVWISEIMLQQTQVKTVLPYFERWMKRFPTIESVARAPQNDILKLWQGLGYYSRAINLQKAARRLVKENSGKMFEAHEQILSLPGIGRYTAGAIASIAFNQPEPLVDGNVVRVFARLLDMGENISLPETQKKFWNIAERLLPKKRARDFNQGLMELGALICSPQKPKCLECPLKKQCLGFKNGTAASLPYRNKRVTKIPIKVVLAVIWKDEKIFIQKRPAKGLMAGLWEFPGGKVEKKETPLNALHREIDEEMGIRISNIKPIQRIRHGYTKFDVDLHCYSAEFETGKIRLTAASEGKWVRLKNLKNYPFPAADAKLIRSLLQT